VNEWTAFLAVATGASVLLWTQIRNQPRWKKELEIMTALERLQAAVTALDERDDQIVALVTGLSDEVTNLQTLLQGLQNVDPQIVAAAEKIEESLSKFAALLPAPAAPTEPAA
jgi:hypothetical protein